MMIKEMMSQIEQKQLTGGRSGVLPGHPIKVLQITSAASVSVGTTPVVETNILLVRLSLEEEIVYANSAFVRALGMPLNEVLGREVTDLVQFADGVLYQKLQKLISHEKTISTTIELQFPDGSVHWYQCVVEVLTENAVQEVQVMGTEVTVVKRMEQVIELQRRLSLSSNLNEAELTQLFFEAVVAMTPFACGASLVYDENQHELSVLKKEGAKLLESNRTLPEPLDRAEFAKLFPQKVTHISFSDFELLNNICNFSEAVAWVELLPIRVENEIQGVILLGNPEKTEINPAYEKQLQSLVGYLDTLLFQVREKRKIFSKEKELQALFRSISEMLLLVNLEGGVIEINPALDRQIRRKNKGTEVETLFDLHPPELKERIKDAIEHTKAKGSTVVQLPLALANGETMTTELEMATGIWHDQPIIICIYKDIRHRIQVEQLENDRRKLASALAASAAILNSSLNLDAVMQHILETVGMVVPNTKANIAVLDGSNSRVVASRGYEQMGTKELLQMRIMDASKVKNLVKMIETKKECLISDTKTNPDWLEYPETIWIRSYVGAPIIVNGTVYGFINCDSDIAGEYSETDAINLKLFADQAAIAIENARLHDEVERHLRQLTKITELTRTVLVSSNVNEVIQKVSEPLLRLFDANSLIITKWEAATNIASCLSVKGEGVKLKVANETPAGTSSLTELVLGQKQAMFFENGGETEELNRLIVRAFTDTYILALPMMVEEIPFGVIFLGFNKKGQVSVDDITIGAYAANQLATAIQKSMMLESEQTLTQQYSHANELITSLSRVSSSVSSSAGPRGIMEAMGMGLEKLHMHSMVFLLDEDPCCAHMEYSSRQNELAAFNSKLEKNYFFESFKVDVIPEFDQVIHQRGSVFLKDIASLFYKIMPAELTPFMHRIFDILAIGPKTKSLVMPLFSENKPVGILNIYGEELMEIDQKAGETFCGQISSALENAKLLAKVQQLAITDELTGVLNRRGLFEGATRQFKSARRLEHDLSVLMLDLDNFKEVNDRFGHDIGDDVLTELVQRVQANIREVDLIGRYGGEEFVAVLVETDLKQAVAVAERIRSVIDKKPIQTQEGAIHTTVSIGVTVIGPQSQAIEELIKQADRALYIAKNRGKNQVATLTG